MGRGWWPSRGNEAVGPMPDTYGYRSTRPEPGNGGLGAAPRGPDGRVVILLVGGRGEQNRNLSEYTDGIWGSNPL